MSNLATKLAKQPRMRLDPIYPRMRRHHENLNLTQAEASVLCQVVVMEVFTQDIAANLRIVTYTEIYLCSDPEEFRHYLLKNGNSNNSERKSKAFIKLVMYVHPLYSVVTTPAKTRTLKEANSHTTLAKE